MKNTVNISVHPEPASINAELQAKRVGLLLSSAASRRRRFAAFTGQSLLLAITSSSAIVVLFIFYFIFRDALPFFQIRSLGELITSRLWFPAGTPPAFGSLAIFAGSGLVTLGAALVAVPLGISAAICISDSLPHKIRQIVKPIIEILAAIPSVAYGFFALVIFAPFLQDNGGPLLAVSTWLIGLPLGGVIVMLIAERFARLVPPANQQRVRLATYVVLFAGLLLSLYFLAQRLGQIQIISGTNALNVSLILGIMAIPTIVSVAEDALQAVGRDLREGSYALGATRAETMLHVVLPAASSGITAAVILGLMRVIGETMVVWMASGNAAQVPEPWFNLLEPIRTLTATIAGDMGEADQVTGSARYHVLFAMAMSLLLISFCCNLASEWVVFRARKKRGS